MSLTCPVDLDMLMLRREISAMYARAATAPGGAFHFHRGPYASLRLFCGDDEGTDGAAVQCRWRQPFRNPDGPMIGLAEYAEVIGARRA